jgi:uracil-DNA glycosylase family 4
MTLQELNIDLLSCRRCPRLVEWREGVAREKRRAYRDWDYWGKPVPGFGDPSAGVFVVGLAPGAYGSNRTGRQFTGDASGDFLYPALYRAGFASQPNSVSREDGLILTNLYTAPICRCVPPDNKPTPQEMANCQPYLERELELIRPKVIVALGRIAFNSILQIMTNESGRWTAIRDPSSINFSHNAIFRLDAEHWLVASFHPSRQNTQTGRLTVEMFDQVWKTVRGLLER